MPQTAPAAVPSRGRQVAVVLLALTIGQLAAATVLPAARFEGKAFGARLIAYPLLMLALPAIWRLRRAGPLPWTAFAWVMAPFLVDVTGNTLDLYDTVGWWDDANHLVNWFLLALGCGLLLERVPVRPRWALGLTVAGLGALLAIGWEVGEYVTFIRHGTEQATAYTDTLGDLLLGSLGAAAAGLLLVRRSPSREVAA